MSLIRHRSTLALVAALGILLPQLALAETKIGYVNTQRVLKESSEMKSIEERITKLTDSKRDEFKPRQEKLTQMAKELQTQSSVLSPEAFEERQIELAQFKSQIERDLQAAQEQVEVEQRKAIAPLLRKVQEIINEIGRDDGFALVIEPHQGVLFLGESIDITDKVIERLNKKG